GPARRGRYAGVPLPPTDLPRSPSGRVPQWVLDERAGRPAAPTAWRGPTATSGRTRAPRRERCALSRRRRQAQPALRALVVTVVGAALVLELQAHGPQRLAAVADLLPDLGSVAGGWPAGG